MKRLLLITFHLSFLFFNSAHAQQNRIFVDNVRSLQVMVNDDPLVPPIMVTGMNTAIKTKVQEMTAIVTSFIASLVAS